MLKGILMMLLVALSAGCDRIQYETKNSKIGKAASKAYTEVTRLPLDGQIEVCEKKENSSVSFFQCMKESGFIENPEYQKYWGAIVLSNATHDIDQGLKSSYLDSINAVRQQGMHNREAECRKDEPQFWTVGN